MSNIAGLASFQGVPHGFHSFQRKIKKSSPFFFFFFFRGLSTRGNFYELEYFFFFLYGAYLLFQLVKKRSHPICGLAN